MLLAWRNLIDSGRSRFRPNGYIQNRANSTFSVMHWNVLASYLGKNTNPWFLHGVSLNSSKRSKIFEEFYTRDKKTKIFKYTGWPAYAQSVLNKEEIHKIEDFDLKYFSWTKRFEKIKKLVSSQNADVISLVELDAFEEMQRYLNQFGYSGEFAPRPRLVSRDGCSLFWKRSEFILLNKSRFSFTDRYNPDPQKDRCALLLLLEHRTSKQSFVFASTHLARDAFKEPPRDGVRARQFGELAVNIRKFVIESGASLVDCPIILCGDVNAVSMAKLTGLVQVSALMSTTEERLHPFVFACKAVDTRGVTSRTEAREARVDAILYSSGSLEAQSLDFSPIIEHAKRFVAPNDVIPSDHFPLLARIGKMSNTIRIAKAVRKWWSIVFPCSQKIKSARERQMLEEDPWNTDVQMDPHDLSQAFKRIDVNQSGYIEVEDAMESLRRLDLLTSVTSLRRQTLLIDHVFSKAKNQNIIDFIDFCGIYFLVHPICERSANVAFDYIDASPRNDIVTVEELACFFKTFEHSPLQGDALELFEDAKARGLTLNDDGLSRVAFKTLLGARFVETTFEDPELKCKIVERMGASKKN